MGSLTVKGDASFTCSGGDFNVSDVANSKGTLNIEDNGIIAHSGVLFIGKGAGTLGTLNISGGALNAATVTITENATSTATINQTGGNNAYGLFQFGCNTSSNIHQTGGQSGLTLQFGW